MTDIKEVTLEDLVNGCVKAQEVIDQTEAELKVLKDEIKDRLIEMQVNGTKIGEYYVSRAKRVSFPDISITQAEEWGAIKRTVDSNKLKQLYDKGLQIKAKVTEYIILKLKEEKIKENIWEIKL